MGESKRRKQLDPSWGLSKPSTKKSSVKLLPDFGSMLVSKGIKTQIIHMRKASHVVWHYYTYGGRGDLYIVFRYVSTGVEYCATLIKICPSADIDETINALQGSFRVEVQPRPYQRFISGGTGKSVVPVEIIGTIESLPASFAE